MSFLTDTYSSYRQNLTLAEKLNYQYPPRLRPELQNDKLTSSFKERFAKKNEDNKIMLVARYENDENYDNSGTFKVPRDATPAEVLATIFNHNAFKMKKEDTEYILKVYGQDEYIYGDRPIIDFLYVQVSFRVFHLLASTVVAIKLKMKFQQIRTQYHARVSLRSSRNPYEMFRFSRKTLTQCSLLVYPVHRTCLYQRKR